MHHDYWNVLYSGAPEPQLGKPMHVRARALHREKPMQWEARTPQLKSNPRSLQLEKADTQRNQK